MNGLSVDRKQQLSEMLAELSVQDMEPASFAQIDLETLDRDLETIANYIVHLREEEIHMIAELIHDDPRKPPTLLMGPEALSVKTMSHDVHHLQHGPDGVEEIATSGKRLGNITHHSPHGHKTSINLGMGGEFAGRKKRG